MKSHILHLTAVALLLTGVFETGYTAKASDKPNAKTLGFAVPQSTFVDKADSGRDPFFPYSTRRRETVVRAVPTNNIPQINALLEKLSLKGISGVKGQPLALINSSTIAEGELAEIRCGHQLVKVRCLEIRERSVLVELDGTRETKEIKLREGI
jgi:hypothetical protein